MWCPKCKNEYKPGITVCADCNTPLVEELPTGKPSDSIFNLQYEDKTSAKTNIQNMTDADEKNMTDVKAYENQTVSDNLPDENSNSPDEEINRAICSAREMSHSYETKRSRYENHHSSAIILLTIGTIGAVAILLHALGIIDFKLIGFSKIMVNVVMGGLFIVFIIFGISSAKSASTYKKQADEEDAFTEKLMTEYKSALNASTIDSVVNISENSSDQKYDNWVKRYSYIFMSIKSSYPQLADNYTEYITEQLYNEIYGVEDVILD